MSLSGWTCRKHLWGSWCRPLCGPLVPPLCFNFTTDWRWKEQTENKNKYRPTRAFYFIVEHFWEVLVNSAFVSCRFLVNNVRVRSLVGCRTVNYSGQHNQNYACGSLWAWHHCLGHTLHCCVCKNKMFWQNLFYLTLYILGLQWFTVTNYIYIFVFLFLIFNLKCSCIRQFSTKPASI